VDSSILKARRAAEEAGGAEAAVVVGGGTTIDLGRGAKADVDGARRRRRRRVKVVSLMMLIVSPVVLYYSISDKNRSWRPVKSMVSWEEGRDNEESERRSKQWPRNHCLRRMHATFSLSGKKIEDVASKARRRGQARRRRRRFAR
jgi:hypothetical protein